MPLSMRWLMREYVSPWTYFSQLGDSYGIGGSLAHQDRAVQIHCIICEGYSDETACLSATPGSKQPGPPANRFPSPYLLNAFTNER